MLRRILLHAHEEVEAIVRHLSDERLLHQRLQRVHGPWRVVIRGKIQNLTIKLAQEVRARPDVKVNALNPGWVRTRMGGANATRSLEEGADTVVWLATLPPDGPSGGFFQDRAPIPW